jgi:hypothetical protein
MITIKLEKDEVTPHLRRLLKEADTNSPLSRVLGRAASNELKKHFRARNANSANKLGGKRTNFWTAVGASVQSPVPSPGKIVIPINHPAIAQKVFGGTITPKRAKNLAIPISPKAHGKSPRVFTGLQFAATRAGVKLLGLKDGNGGMEWLYVLKKSVTQAPDPDALPKDAKVADAMTKAGDIYLRSRR